MSASADQHFRDQFGERLGRLRERHKLSKRALAMAVKVTPSQMGRYEAGLALPSIPVMARLRDVLGVSADELMFGSRAARKPNEFAELLDVLNQFTPAEKRVARSLLDALILQHEANRKSRQ